MCGIAGYVGHFPVDQPRIDECLMRMRQRGPDASGFTERTLADGAVAQLLHSRLSILDLDPRSNQPFTTGRSTIVLNGEIYNYLELASELKGRGVHLDTTGDTEVAAHLLEEHGVAALPKFEAMFAFAWVDEATGTLMLARDRFGEKPLFTYETDDGIYFGSEVQYLTVLSGQQPRVNDRQIARFLVNGYKDLYKREETFFEEIKRVPAGTRIVRTSLGEWQAESFRGWGSVTVDDTLTFEEAVSGTLQRVIHATELRLRSDVPVALCLSGGIDSNLLMGVIRNVLKRDVQPFSIVGSDYRYDESEAIAESARWFGVTPQLKSMSGVDALGAIEQMTLARGSPVATANQFALWHLMSEIASRGYKVVISGLGADELFSGYYDHHLYFLHDMGRADETLALQKRAEWERVVIPLVRNPLFRTLSDDLDNPGYIGSLVFGDTSSRRGSLTEVTQDWDLSWDDVCYDASLLRNRLANELLHETVPLTLHEEDQNAMFWSVENRAPYLDSRLLAWSRSVPLRYFIRDGRAKAVLRAAGDGIVPESVLTNPRKTGFNLSVKDLLPDNRQLVVDYVGDSGLARLVNMTAVRAVLTQEDFSDSDNKLAFSLLSCAAFSRVFDKP